VAAERSRAIHLAHAGGGEVGDRVIGHREIDPALDDATPP